MISRSPHTQKGLALITAMLVVAIVATIATYVSLGQQVWLRQVQNLSDRGQADSMRHATLDWIAIVLLRDAKNSKIDSLDEIWAKTFPPLPFEGGTISVAISDAQARFNLNNLVRNGQPSVPDIGVFQQLLRLRKLDPTLAEAVVDWLDPDNQTRPGGAEDTEYLAMSPPYRTANQALTSVDELRLIKGFDADAVEKLRPYVIALPEPTAINVNTASEVVLAALFPSAPPSLAEQVVQVRTSQPFTDIERVKQIMMPGQQSAQQKVVLDVKTAYFLVQIEIGYGRWRRSTLASIHRAADGKTARVLWHHPQYPPLPRDDESTDRQG